MLSIILIKIKHLIYHTTKVINVKKVHQEEQFRNGFILPRRGPQGRRCAFSNRCNVSAAAVMAGAED
jgi:hypothetical protein